MKSVILSILLFCAGFFSFPAMCVLIAIGNGKKEAPTKDEWKEI